MTVAVMDKDVFADFEPTVDAYFFKLGSFGLVSFYGKNYTIKKQLSAEDQTALLTHPSFVRVAYQCYANKEKILAIQNQLLLFKDKESYPRTLTISPWLQRQVKRHLSVDQVSS